MGKHLAVEATGLTKIYGDQRVVDSINFHVEPGECFGLLGPNGAGKTTTLRMLLGNVPSTEGKLNVLGFPIPEEALAMRQRIGVVPQHDNLDPDFTVAENLRTYSQYFRLPRALQAQRIKVLLNFAALEHKAAAGIGTLSGGMRRRLVLARALINDPDLLILDEPTTGLDPQARQFIWRQLRNLLAEGKTLILTTHYMEEAERLCDRLMILDNGRIIDTGTPLELIRNNIEPHVIEVYGPEFEPWHQQYHILANRHEMAGETGFYYVENEQPLLQSLRHYPSLHFLHRRANLEDVFIKLTGKELRDDQ